jgi:hypothetical protein
MSPSYYGCRSTILVPKRRPAPMAHAPGGVRSTVAPRLPRNGGGKRRSRLTVAFRRQKCLRISIINWLPLKTRARSVSEGVEWPTPRPSWTGWRPARNRPGRPGRRPAGRTRLRAGGGRGCHGASGGAAAVSSRNAMGCPPWNRGVRPQPLLSRQRLHKPNMAGVLGFSRAYWRPATTEQARGTISGLDRPNEAPANQAGTAGQCT